MMGSGRHSLDWRLWRFASDVGACATAAAVAVLLASNGYWLTSWTSPGSAAIALFTLSTAALLLIARADRMIWRFTSFTDAVKLLIVTALGTLLIVPVLLLWRGSSEASIGFFLRLWSLSTAFLFLPRVVSRALAEGWFDIGARSLRARRDRDAMLLAGESYRIEAFLREIGRSPSYPYMVAGILTDERKLAGSRLHGIPVLGNLAALSDVLEHLKLRGLRPKRLVLAMDKPSAADVAKVVDAASAMGLDAGQLLPMGSVDEATGGVRPFELADLLGRPEIFFDLQAVETMITGRRVLITGAGGSIGSELSRQIASLCPAKLVLTDASEFNLYAIDMEISARHPEVCRRAVLMDVRDEGHVSHVISDMKPHVVFHAAALKHVPLVEFNPLEAIKTNVLGTANVANAVRSLGVKAMVVISTDKAVNPHNVMGATKRLAEAYCQAMDQLQSERTQTRFMTVRFGNVLGSTGSVVPLFMRQLEAGGPLTVTHPEITRYFMTIPEAVRLVLQAGARGISLDEDRGSIYILDMGEPVKIVDLARQIIRLSGKRPDTDIRIEFTGLRPGEKLYEETVHGDELVEPTESRSVLKVRPRQADLRILMSQLEELRQATYRNDCEKAIRVLSFSVPEFCHSRDRVEVSQVADTQTPA